MKKPFRLKHFEKIVSIFIFLAIFFVFTMVVLLAKQKRLFSDKITYYTIIDTANNIAAGQEITLKGPNVAIGKVEGFSINKDNKVIVNFFIYQEYEQKVRTDSIIIFTPPLFGMLGSFKVEITPGTDYYPALANGSIIPSNQMFSGAFLLSLGHDKQEEEIPILNKINPLLENVTSLLDPKGQLIKNVTSLLYHLNIFTMQLNQGGVFSVMGSPALKSNLERMTAEVNFLLSSSGNMVNGLNPKMKEILSQVYLLLIDVEKITSSVNYNIPKTMGQLNTILFRVDRMVEKLEKSPLLGSSGYKGKSSGGTRDYFEGQ
ncbi:MAG TPA: hypothetical protein DHW82_08585 [Spirochaetia bacterium]|nr:MAG: hypothetical protein A2Y41_04950 [Spirochaetes bacterium GWB1_36_13]HCL57046.1 hypothetical protein [Spirochaetia bacterium]